MISRVMLKGLFLLSLFSCNRSDDLLLFDKKNNTIIVSPKLKGKNLDIYKMKNNDEIDYLNFDTEETIIIKKNIYTITELGITNGLYRVSVSYMGKIEYIDITIK